MTCDRVAPCRCADGCQVLPQLGRRDEKRDPSPARWGILMKDALRRSAMNITSERARLPLRAQNSVRGRE